MSATRKMPEMSTTAEMSATKMPATEVSATEMPTPAEMPEMSTPAEMSAASKVPEKSTPAEMRPSAAVATTTAVGTGVGRRRQCGRQDNHSNPDIEF